MKATIEHREDAAPTIVAASVGRHVRVEASVDRESWLAAERALDQVLADSFPASDPPPWTLGIARPKSLGHAVSVEPARRMARADLERATGDVIHVSLPRHDERSFRRGLFSRAGAASIALFVPFAILLIGLPFVLIIRGLREAIGRHDPADRASGTTLRGARR